MFASEWRADSQALAADGMYWRSVYGGARLVLGCIRVTPVVFAFMRLMLACACGLILVLEAYRDPITSVYWLLPFHHWVMALELFYFAMASLLTIVAVCTAGSGGIARSTPFYVRVTELAYGAVYPAAWIAACSSFAITFINSSHCVSAAEPSDQQELAILTAALLAIMLIDAGFNRQPYYASFHAIVGLLFCWAWLLFSALYELLGGRDQYGHTYIYRCLDWSYPISGGRYNAEGKLLYLNLFLVVPLINYLYWLLIWARRRTLTIYKKADAGLQQPLTQTPRPPTSRRVLFEYVADYRDLALDGRHWRAQFGGSSSPKAPKMGAYVLCDATSYPMFRLVCAVAAVSFLVLRMVEFQQENDQWSKAFLYFENWVLLLSALYFTLAWMLTTFASCTEGAESSGTPLIIWFIWACYGALLPAAIINSLMFIFVTTRYSVTGLTNVSGNDLNRVFDVTSNYATLVIVFIDAWVNRQPYYATYHSFMGVFFSWAYFIFNITYVLLGQTNENGLNYIYRQLNWKTYSAARFFTPGLVTLSELFVLVPLLNALYWCMLWARRRARVAAKQNAV